MRAAGEGMPEFTTGAAYTWLRQAGLSMQRCKTPRKYTEQDKAEFFRRFHPGHLLRLGLQGPASAPRGPQGEPAAGGVLRVALRG